MTSKKADRIKVNDKWSVDFTAKAVIRLSDNKKFLWTPSGRGGKGVTMPSPPVPMAIKKFVQNCVRK